MWSGSSVAERFPCKELDEGASPFSTFEGLMLMKSKMKPLWSSQSVHWSTPEGLYLELDKEFHFTYDPCPLDCKDLTKGLLQDWNGRVFINPPYNNISNFLNKARLELKKGHIQLAVFLIPSRTDTKWWHAHAMKADTIRFIKGRLKFGGSRNSAPFPSCVVIYK